MVAHSRVQEQKRHGRHQKHTRNFVKVYWPYIPLLSFVIIGLVFNSYWQPRTRSSVLPYATSMSSSALLSQTNIDRAENGVKSLSLNSKLSQAAQAKANDMVARNYWSHNTPDGKEPWTFIAAAGYSYQKAGENLAYGFLTSQDTIAGWMNSAPHRENLLDSAYKDVGFGFANSNNFNSDGPETVVVAMYGEVLGATTATAPIKSSTPKSTAPAAVKTTPAPVAKSAPAPKPAAKSDTAVKKPQPVTTQQPITSEPPAQRISRFAAFTQGTIPWAASSISMIMVAGIAVLAIKHGLAMRRWILKGERYVLHHALFDTTVISIIGLCIILTRTAGVIR